MLFDRFAQNTFVVPAVARLLVNKTLSKLSRLDLTHYPKEVSESQPLSSGAAVPPSREFCDNRGPKFRQLHHASLFVSPRPSGRWRSRKLV